jgi:hypothetical protein
LLTTTHLGVEDLWAILDGAFVYNGRGPVQSFRFYGADGRPVEVAAVDIVSVEPGLQIIARPDPEVADVPGVKD